MKDTPMPARTKPLARISPAQRARGAAWRRVRAVVWMRCDGSCEACGQPLDREAWECHHRRFKSSGGRDIPENALGLHGNCHSLVHLGDRVVQETLGRAVPSTQDPAAVPVVVYGRGAVYLDGGGYRPVTRSTGRRAPAPDGGGAA